ncbi:hydrolase [Sugiyamaella lignohabitans]|uniref:Hydrolase n=1 Tax=Sugiyamaella lignohabitans TaxID=796027 RepID=A0A161HGR7_9ASCO|nr:hydrolase [Sugiyamaella lignohabitans]ANB14990.1 hydrolase [Sugiyamaella lignohabitans]
MRLRIENGLFKDQAGREVILRGINLAGDAKNPPLGRSKSPSERSDSDSSGLIVIDNVDENSYVGSPFPLAEADIHLERLKKAGFNTIRYIFTWDALEHSGPGIYDDKYIAFTIEILKKIRNHGLMVFLDPHQDVWSRFSGGSGAPLWTLELLGLNKAAFMETQAAIVLDGETPPPIKMLWASNYHRLVCQVMFTVFFAGEHFAPKCKVNDLNVGLYLRQHYFDAIMHFARKVAEVPELEDTVLGWESMNEPGHGLIAYPDITKLPDDPEHVKLGSSPTPFQAMLLGLGIPQTVDVWTFTSMGGKKSGTQTICPSKPVWFTELELAEIDLKYKWNRSWPGGCIWGYHGVYEGKTVVRPDYFTFSITGKPLKPHAFVEEFFVEHWLDYEKRIHDIKPDWFVFMQTPVNNKPPDLRGRGIKFNEATTVYTPHYYDGLTLMLKRWKQINVDAVGVVRNHYWSPVLAVRIGEKAIRNCMTDQLRYIKTEGKLLIGENTPCLFSEIGIPYDLDSKRAYQTGQYNSQIRAMDANHNALDQSHLHHTLWVYTANNSHKHGDHWNGEDLSIWSKDDQVKGINDGFRAGEAVIRPYPVAVNGKIKSYGFDISKALFSLTLHATDPGISEVYLPEFYFTEERTGVSTSSGTWKIKSNTLYWSHSSGTQTLRVRGIPKHTEQPCVIM